MTDTRLPRFGAGGRVSPNGGDSDRVGTNGNGDEQQQRRRKTMAQQANALDVYEDAVQEPLLECHNLASMYYNAQEIGSRQPDAKVLREDFCSSAVVAQTWLGLGVDHRAQGVDIDLDALRVARRRLMRSQREGRTAVIVQSAAYSGTGKARELEGDDEEDVDLVEAQRSNDTTSQTNGETIDADRAMIESTDSTPSSSTATSSSTWAQGAASDRFERRFQARLAKERAKAEREERQNGVEEQQQNSNTKNVLILQHADVLSLPIQGIDAVEAPDLVYAGNYALSYFHDRRSLLAYLAQCRRTLRKHTGVLIVDPFAGPTTWDAVSIEERAEQDTLWERFAREPGFLRDGERQPPSPLRGQSLELWKSESSTPANQPSSADWRNWPRGRLVLVRKGHVGGGYEYWREDGSLDYTTNRFRMSLSFRFRDGSWLRDYFSYDFRVWSLREITEAMQEVGFARVAVHAIPRTTEQDAIAAQKQEYAQKYHARSDSASSSNESGTADDDVGLDGMADLMRRTEKNEAEKSTYTIVEDDQKLFATRSFGTYIIACMPSVEGESNT